MANIGPENFVIECPCMISLRRTVMSHGWVGLEPWTWDEKTAVLGRPELLPSGIRAQLKVMQNTPSSFLVTVDGQVFNTADLKWARMTVARWLSIGWDPKPALMVARRIDSTAAKFISNGGGRFLRGTTFYEDFTKTMCTIQISWTRTRHVVASLVDKVGRGLFPTPLDVLDAGETFLRREVRLGFRSPQLLEATDKMLKEGVMDEYGREVEGRITYESLIRLRGIGSYAASHVGMLLHDFRRIPVDSEVRRFFSERYGILPDEIEGLFDRWGEFRVLGYKISRQP